MICPGCSGVVGRDCFNPGECEWICRDMEARAAGERIAEERAYEEYWREQERIHYAELEQEYLAEKAADGHLDRAGAS